MRLESLGTGLSLACAAHCAALPLLAGAAAAWHSHSPGGIWLEAGMIGTAAAIGLATLGPAFFHHRRPWPLLSLISGLALLIAGHTAAMEHIALFSVAGAGLVVLAQSLNRRCQGACCAARRDQGGGACA